MTLPSVETEMKEALVKYAASVSPPQPPVVDILAATRKARRRKAHSLAAAAVTVAVGASTAMAVATRSGSHNDGVTLPTTVKLLEPASGSARLPNLTTTEWATYADHVVVVRPVRESKDSDLPNARRILLDVDQTIWSSPRSTTEVPMSLSISAVGTEIVNGSTIKVAISGAPRIEIGHSYLAAISWVDARCASGDGRTSGHYELLGGNAVVPFDESTIGNGEVEGRFQSADEARAEAEKVPAQRRGVAAEFAGQSASALAAALSGTDAPTRIQFTPEAPCT